MSIFPLYDKVLIKKIITEEKIGDIYVSKIENNLTKGIVCKVGLGKCIGSEKFLPLLVKENDIVLFKENYNTEKYKFNNIDYFFVNENDIYAIIK